MGEFTKYQEMGPYHWKWYKTNKFGYAAQVKKILGLFPRSGALLDIGGGDGLISYKLFLKGLRVTCIDADPVAIYCAKSTATRHYIWSRPWLGIYYHLKKKNAYEELVKKGLKFRLQSAYDLETSEKYDFALCHEVIEHVPDAKKLAEIIESITLKYAIITTPNADYNKPGELDHKFYRPGEIVTLFSPWKVKIIEDNPTIIAEIEK